MILNFVKDTFTDHEQDQLTDIGYLFLFKYLKPPWCREGKVKTSRTDQRIVLGLLYHGLTTCQTSLLVQLFTTRS